VIADTTSLAGLVRLDAVDRDYHVCRQLTEQSKVTGIPPATFYSAANRHLASNHARCADHIDT
jgi:hypothetical protein